MRRNDGLCPACGVNEKRDSCSYCPECFRARQRRNYRKRVYSPGRVAKKIDPQSCNCGDRSCNGLSCERVSA
jgi:hypothetical protein